MEQNGKDKHIFLKKNLMCFVGIKIGTPFENVFYHCHRPNLGLLNLWALQLGPVLGVGDNKLGKKKKNCPFSQLKLLGCPSPQLQPNPSTRET